MNPTLRIHRSTVFALATLLIFSATSYAAVPLADRAGVWTKQRVESTMTTATGVKTGVELGPARAAALGHLDSDGVIDLVVAYGTAEGAYAVVTLGDPRFRLGAKHDRMRELDGLPPERPFAAESVVYPVPFAPDWAAVGDWDADGDFDVVFAARGGDLLYWMAGDGQGVLDDGREVKLGGGVTAFVSHEVNRRDGLDDLVITVIGVKRARLLVFESPLGALMGEPESHVMPSPVNDVVVDYFDDDGWPDIAASAGESVVILSGRDRKLTLTREKREAVPAAESVSLTFDGQVTGIAAGDFVGRDRRAQLAVRQTDGNVTLIRRLDKEFHRSVLGTLPLEGQMSSARVSGLPGHDLVLLGCSSDRVEIFHAENAKSTASRLEPVPAPGGAVSAVVHGRLNLDTRDDMVMVQSDGSVEVAASKNRLALVVNSTTDTDDGTCDASHCSFREAINEANIQPSGPTITFDLTVGSTIQPTSALPALTQTASTSIDGTVGSSPFTGLLRIRGDLASASTYGMRIHGGNASISHLIIGGFGGNGLELANEGNNTVSGCRIGLDETGGAADANERGISINDSSGNTIGGTAPGEGNVISGNDRQGIALYGDSTANLIMGNLVGTDGNGSTAIANSNGVYGYLTDGNQIGSMVGNGGNVISGNSQGGVSIVGSGDPGEAPWLVVNNIIGLDKDGTAVIQNTSGGLSVEFSTSSTIGGTSPVARNVISGNTGSQINAAENAVFLQIQGNYVGTDITGTVAVGGGLGIELYGAEETTVGGAVNGAGNVISSLDDDVVWVSDGALTSHTDILGNRVGIGADGSELGNRYGIRLEGGQFFTIGSSEAPNMIGGITDVGVAVFGSCQGASIGPNSIFGNGTLGVDIGDDGVTANDPLDADTGPNGLQNFPEIEHVVQATGDVDFYVRSTPSTAYVVRFFESPACHASGHGEGRTYLGTTTVVTEANGEVSDLVTLGPLSGGAVVTATATDPAGNTSEFSMCFEIPYPAGHIFSDGFESGDTVQWTETVG